MQTKQTRFPYILITESQDVVAKASEIAVNGIEEARGVYAFQADMEFEVVRSTLQEGNGEIGLIQVQNSQYLRAQGDLARLIGHLR